MNIITKLFLPVLVLFISLNSCVEENFDQPPTDGSDPGLTVTTTIAELKAMHTMGSFETIGENLVIKGVVVADDASGNWYRSFVLQDETAGITILIDITESYFLYPAGREVYVKLKNLVIGDYNNLIQLGGYVASDGSLGEIVEVTDHLIKSVKRGVPAPKVMTINQLSINDVSTLIQLDDVMFLDTFSTYADAINQNASNASLSDCSNNTVLVRTSGFADFAGTKVASGGGTFVGVLSIFRDDFQFMIRDLDDLQMDGPRCGNGGNGGGPCTPLLLSGVEEDFENGSNNDQVDISGWHNLATKGSRTWQFKEFDGNVYCQGTAFGDTSPEMETWLITPFIKMDEPKTLTFESAKAFWTHDGLSVWVSTNFECDPLEAVWQPINATLADENDDDHAWIPSGDIDLSGLVGNEIVIGFKYVGNANSGLTGSFRIDNLKLGEGGGGPIGDPCTNGTPPLEVDVLNVDFSSGTNNDEVAETGWTNVPSTGTRNWIYKEFDGNVYVQATAFNDASPETGSWLVTPLINVNGPKTIRFETAKAFWTHDALTVWISTDFNCDPLTATWTALNATLAGQNDADHDWIPSGDIDLSGYMGSKVAIGFKYEGNNNAGLTASYRVDNVVVE